MTGLPPSLAWWLEPVVLPVIKGDSPPGQDHPAAPTPALCPGLTTRFMCEYQQPLYRMKEEVSQPAWHLLPLGKPPFDKLEGPLKSTANTTNPMICGLSRTIKVPPPGWKFTSTKGEDQLPSNPGLIPEKEVQGRKTFRSSSALHPKPMLLPAAGETHQGGAGQNATRRHSIWKLSFPGVCQQEAWQV